MILFGCGRLRLLGAVRWMTGSVASLAAVGWVRLSRMRCRCGTRLLPRMCAIPVGRHERLRMVVTVLIAFSLVLLPATRRFPMPLRMASVFRVIGMMMAGWLLSVGAIRAGGSAWVVRATSVRQLMWMKPVMRVGRRLALTTFAAIGRRAMPDAADIPAVAPSRSRRLGVRLTDADMADLERVAGKYRSSVSWAARESMRRGLPLLVVELGGEQSKEACDGGSRQGV